MLCTNHSITGASDGSLDIMGTLLVKIKSNVTGLTTRTMIYICSNKSTTILLKTVCRKIGIASVEDNAECNARESKVKCDCPVRSATPNLPTALPFQTVEENLPKLEEWIKDFWASSAFNTCPHQPLQEMKGEPLSITFKDNYVPVQRHKPVPVPYHWKEQVKSSAAIKVFSIFHIMKSI